MAKAFNVACAALSAVSSLDDDRRTHWVTATVPSLTAFPLQVRFSLTDMATESGWDKRRPVVMWVTGATSLIRATVRRADLDSDHKILHVMLDTYAWSSRSLEKLVKKNGRPMDNGHLIDACVRLTKAPATSNPTYDNISRIRAFEHLLEDTTASTIMDRVYGATPLGCPNHDEPQLVDPIAGDLTYTINNRDVTLSDEQRDAVALGTSNLPIVGIQAAFGTGKTVVGAIIAVQRAVSGKKVLVTASTNAAVAQFAQTILSLSAFRHLRVLRYVSDTAVMENLTPTPVDMNTILMSIGDQYAAQLTDEQKQLCAKFTAGRAILEEYLADPDKAANMSDEDKEEYSIAERNVSKTLAQMIKLMLQFRPPDILCITTASLLNTIGTTRGAFSECDRYFYILIGDEASQIPEPALAAIANLLPQLQHVYIGDVHQLEPHARCHRDSPAATYGARGVMSVIWTARAVPVAPLVQTYRAHPALIELPNRVAYDGALVSGIAPESRPMLVTRISFPTPTVPFMFVDVKGRSQRAQNMSHYNLDEADACAQLVGLLRAQGIAADDICIITFYRGQFRRVEHVLMDLNIEISTVDSVQGREMEVVILLTTKTNFSPDSAEFLDDYKRMNVALSRCRQGQFVLGHLPSLSQVPFWGRVIDWATSLNAVVPRHQLGQYFSSV